ncbi:MAG TPA: RidA family protein [Woeseiaceae bacterium]|nr:RidA family protein [Woeseiaceae bacterium]
MSEKKLVKTGTEWEPLVGYCRAVRVGAHVAVSGSAPVGENGELVGEGDMYLQTRRCIEIIAAALAEAGAGLEDVVRTRIFVTDIDRWKDVAQAHREFFADVTPACSMVEVSRLIGPGMLVEIEADAIIG